MDMGFKSVFIVRETEGTYALNGPPKCEPWEGLQKDPQEARFATVSGNGNLVAIGNNTEVNVYDARDGSHKCRIQQRMLSASFSPCGAYLMEWNNPSQNVENFQIWAVGKGKDVAVVHKMKLSKLPECQFSQDEKVWARLSNHSIIFSKAPEFGGTDKKTPEGLKIEKFSLSTMPHTPEQGPMFVACYIPATTSGQPSFARMYRYPNFDGVIASKSFFQADRVEMKWNKKGSAMLLITMTDVDKTGQSYYGKTLLHYMDIKGETFSVNTEKDGNIIHAAEWNPNSTEFAIITGKMPHTKAALLNTKGDIILDMEVSARNAIYFNPQGNLLLLCGFGNLAHGRIEVWEVSKHRRMIATCSASNTTQLEWLSDGCHFVTAITAPRMQVGNEFRVWNFQGKEVYKWEATKHLFGIIPLNSEPPVALPVDELEKFVKSGAKPSIAKMEEQKKAAVYVPPSKRLGVVGAAPQKGASQPAGQSQLSENEKKARAIKKKLDQIEKIKQLIKDGQKVEKNQEDKLKTESDLLKQLQDLGLS